MGTILTQDEQYECYVKGRETRRVAREIVRLRDIAKRKRVPTREELTPPIQSDAERGSGNSINARLHRLLRGSLVILLLAGAVQAQEPKKDKFRWFDKADAAYWAGAFADTGTSIGKGENSPLWRDERHIYSPAKNLAFKGGLWLGLKLGERAWYHPKARRRMRWVIGGAGVVFTIFAVHNATQSKAK